MTVEARLRFREGRGPNNGLDHKLEASPVCEVRPVKSDYPSLLMNHYLFCPWHDDIPHSGLTIYE